MENNNLIEPVIICPHCGEYVLIEKIKCSIFRHGTLKKNGKQINPHSTKHYCDNLIKHNMIHGCGKPFKVKTNDNKLIAEICDYI